VSAKNDGGTNAEWPIKLYFVMDNKYSTRSPVPTVYSIRAKQRGADRLAFEERHQFFGFRSHVKCPENLGAKLTTGEALAWYREKQLSRIQRAKEDIATAELRLKQADALLSEDAAFANRNPSK
jgi:hypothetical protein